MVLDKISDNLQHKEKEAFQIINKQLQKCLPEKIEKI